MSPSLSLASLMTHRFDAVALNPQPLPPREALASVADEQCGNVPRKLPHWPPPPPPPRGQMV